MFNYVKLIACKLGSFRKVRCLLKSAPTCVICASETNGTVPVKREIYSQESWNYFIFKLLGILNLVYTMTEIRFFRLPVFYNTLLQMFRTAAAVILRNGWNVLHWLQRVESKYTEFAYAGWKHICCSIYLLCIISVWLWFSSTFNTLDNSFLSLVFFHIVLGYNLKRQIPLKRPSASFCVFYSDRWPDWEDWRTDAI